MPRVTHPFDPDEPSLTRASDAVATDGKSLIDRWVRTGTTIQAGSEPRYGDFSNFSDYHSAVEAVRSARDDFMALPANIRQECRNDPGVFLETVASEEGLAALLDMGLDPNRRPAADQKHEADQADAETAEKEPVGDA